MAEQNNGADVELNLAGQKVNLRNVKSLNTLATIATLVIVCVLVYAFWEHKMDAMASGASQASATRELVQAIREGNCINSYTEAERESKVEFCRRVTR